MKMKAAIYYGPGDIRLEQIERPRAEDGIDGLGMVMKVGACGVCSVMDLPAWKRTWLTYGTGHALGHEFSGEVVEVGPRVTAVKVGDKAYGLSYRPCYECKACQARDWARCANFNKGAVGERINGGFAEYLLFPFVTDQNIIKLPQTMSFRDGALIEPLSLGAGLANKAKSGDVVVIFGQELTGLGALARLKEGNVARKIIVCDVSGERLKASQELGADIVVDELNEDIVQVVNKETTDEGAEVVIVTVGRPNNFQQAIDVARHMGTIWLGTSYDAPFLFHPTLQRPGSPWSNITQKGGVSIHCAWGTLGAREQRPTGVWLQALKLIQSGRVTADKYVTHVFPLEKIKEAFWTAMDPHKSIKVMIEP
jgi:threonine dehydrogenase-like Zn-dependent dehydrogenase